MVGKRKNGVVLSILLSLISVSNSVSFSTHLEYQTLDLHHIDNFSPRPGSTAESNIDRRLNRNRLRVEALSDRAAAPADSSFKSSVFSRDDSDYYFTHFEIGTPATKVNLTLDTGSDMTWLQCSPCVKCYKQTGPIFNPHKSKSHSTVECGDSRCNQLEIPLCDKQNLTCLYNVSYGGDGSFTSGQLLSETLTFGETRVENVTLGCGHDNEGMLSSGTGIFGLGRGNLSFINQIGNKFQKKFSYCMPPKGTKSSSIQFGNKAVPQNASVTPMLSNPKYGEDVGLYYVGLNGISVNGSRLQNINQTTFKFNRTSGHGGVIIDSGVIITQLVEPAYRALRDAFLNASTKLGIISSYKVFDTCFNATEAAPDATVPKVTLHFDDDAHMSLSELNYLIGVGNSTYCLAFAGTSKSGLSIIGNIQQLGFRVSYDLESKKVGFTADSCTS